MAQHRPEHERTHESAGAAYGKKQAGAEHAGLMGRRDQRKTVSTPLPSPTALFTVTSAPIRGRAEM